MKQSKNFIRCIAWYKPEQRPRPLEISIDGDELEDTFDQWQTNAEKTLKDLAAQGVFPEKVVIDVNDLLARNGEKGVFAVFAKAPPQNSFPY